MKKQKIFFLNYLMVLGILSLFIVSCGSTVDFYEKEKQDNPDVQTTSEPSITEDASDVQTNIESSVTENSHTDIDSDIDGISDDKDNCVNIANADQSDVI